MNDLHLAFVPLARPTFDVRFATAMAHAAYTNLHSQGYSIEGSVALVQDIDGARRVTSELAEAPLDLLVLFQATFADSTMAMAIAQALDVPILLWAIPEAHTGGRLRLNSICGTNLAAHALKRARLNYWAMYAAPDDPALLDKVERYARAGRVRRLFRGAKIGRVGEHPAGFETCAFDRAKLRAVFGLEVVQIDLRQQVFEQAGQVKSQRVQEIMSKLAQQVEGLERVDAQATQGSLRAYSALRHLAAKDQFGGFAVRCWPEFFTELGCAACGAMSMLSDEGIPCSCEADVNGTITQMMLQWISDEPAFGADVVSLDMERDALVLWHCGLAPLSMADPAERPGVTVHSNRGLPLLMEFTLKPGPVTVARLSETSGEYRLVLARGEMLRGPKSFSGTSGLLHFEAPAQAVLDAILEHGLEHHISITYGDHVATLESLADMLGLPMLKLAQEV